MLYKPTEQQQDTAKLQICTTIFQSDIFLLKVNMQSATTTSMSIQQCCLVSK